MVYLIIRTNEEGSEKTVAACQDEETAEAWKAELETLEELHQAGWTYKVEPLRLSL